MLDYRVIGLIVAVLTFHAVFTYIRERWHTTHSPMTFQYNKKEDVGQVFVQRRPWKVKKTVLIEEVAEGIQFQYDKDTGELWGIRVQGNNKKTGEE